MDARRGGRGCWCTTPTRPTPCPRASGFAGQFAKVGFKVSTSLYLDETAALCDLLLPQHHALERWDDLRPRAGVHGLMQPVMEPVFNTLPAGDVLLRVAKKAGGALARFTAPSYEAHLKTRWQALAGELGEADCRGVLARGAAAGRRVSAIRRPPPGSRSRLADGRLAYTKPAFEGDGEFVFAHLPARRCCTTAAAPTSPGCWRTPIPVTKITWHSWVEVSPDTARRLDVRDGEIVELTSPHGTIEAPVYVYPGIRDDVVAVPLGFGHTEYGTFAKGRGVNALDLLGAPRRRLPALPLDPGVGARRPGTTRSSPAIAGDPRQLGRGIAEAMPLEAAQKGLTVEQAYLEEGHGKHEVNTERELEALKGWAEEQSAGDRSYGDYAERASRSGAWRSTSPSAPAARPASPPATRRTTSRRWAKTEILRGREMTWIRIERYWEGGEEPGEPRPARVRPDALPALRQRAVRAGLPGVRRLPHARRAQRPGLQPLRRHPLLRQQLPLQGAVLQLVQVQRAGLARAAPPPAQPDVTVRARGVMEKCTFCIQRIRGAQNQARLEDRPHPGRRVHHRLRPGLPVGRDRVRQRAATRASRVARLQQDQRGYHVLEDLNVRPAITYLAKVLLPAEA